MRGPPNISIRVEGGMAPSTCVELARAAEAAGLAGVWFAENAFARGILPAAAAPARCASMRACSIRTAGIRP
jgi:5,10-methylenetetrahydromethanopterin reductase